MACGQYLLSVQCLMKSLFLCQLVVGKVWLVVNISAPDINCFVLASISL